MEIGPIDHVALSVPDLPLVRELLEGHLDLTLRRTGTRKATGGDLAILSDRQGMKLELVDEGGSEPVLLHLAFRVDDVERAAEMLTSSSDQCTVIRPKVWLETARAEFCTVRHSSGLEIQLVRYDDDSPDI